MNNVGDALRVKQVQHARVGAERTSPPSHEVPDHTQDLLVLSHIIREDRGVLLDLAQNPGAEWDEAGLDLTHKTLVIDHVGVSPRGETGRLAV